MRILRLTAAAMAVTAAVLVDPPVAAAAPAPILFLSPSSGPKTTSINATYVFPVQDQQGVGGCEAERVTFSWEGQDVGQPVQARSAGGRGTGQGSCVANLTFPPPSGLNAPGPHRVAATNGKTSGGALFIVTGDPAPSPAPPTQIPSPAPAVSAPSPSASSPRPSQSATHSSARPSTSASASVEPLPSEVPTIDLSPAVGGAVGKPVSGSIVMIVAVIVGALTIAGAGLLIGLMLRNRPDADEAPADAATAEP